MKSKEAIIEKQYEGKRYSAPKDKELYAAMDEYAQQQSIAFAEWKDNNWWKFNRTENFWFRWGREKEERATSAELFTLYQQTLNK